MQILILAMVIGMLVADPQRVTAEGVSLGFGLLAGLAGAKIAWAGLYAACVGTARRPIVRGGDGRWLMRLEWISAVYRWGLLGLFGLDLSLGMLAGLRRVLFEWLGVEHLIVVDELLFMTPTLGLIVWGWWCYYPIDRRLREADLMRRLDEGAPVRAIWSRGQFLLAQFRHQIAIMLGPLVVLLAWWELAPWLANGAVVHAPSWVSDRPIALDVGTVLLVAGTATVLAMAPVMIRYMWDTVPLADGELRRELEAMCRRYRVRVRQLLLWRTFGCMSNAAVMGLVGPVRYILLSDGLLESLPKQSVQAVMAHELAHVRRHHLFWLMAAAAGTLGALEVAMAWGFTLTGDAALAEIGLWQNRMAAYGGLAVMVVIWAAVFGWVSRRFERQADSLAAVSLATQRYEAEGVSCEGGVVIGEQDAMAVADALGRVAALNHMPLRRPSWRHGSIAWRQRNLRSLAGQRTDKLSIDRQVRRIKWASLAVLFVVIAAYCVLGNRGLWF